MLLTCARDTTASPTARLLALRVLLERFEHDAPAQIDNMLGALRAQHGHYDVPDAALITMALTLRVRGDSAAFLEQQLPLYTSMSSFERLSLLAIGRMLVEVTAAMYARGAASWTASQREQIALVAKLLLPADSEWAAQMRVYFLRELERSRGKAFIATLPLLPATAPDRLPFFGLIGSADLCDRSDLFAALYGDGYVKTRVALAAEPSALLALAESQRDSFRVHFLLAIHAEVRIINQFTMLNKPPLVMRKVGRLFHDRDEKGFCCYIPLYLSKNLRSHITSLSTHCICQVFLFLDSFLFLFLVFFFPLRRAKRETCRLRASTHFCNSYNAHPQTRYT